MGINDRANDAKQNKRDKAKAARSRRADNGGAADYASVDWLPIVALVEALAAAQGAVRLGYTRDGAAYAIGCYQADDYATEYVRPAENWEAAITDIAEAWCPDGGDHYHNCLNRMRATGKDAR